MTGVVKTQDNPCFGSRVDKSNATEDPSYAGVLVALQAMKVPANGDVKPDVHMKFNYIGG
eukprot:11561740-Ditylum_brightwellii.AAC.1